MQSSENTQKQVEGQPREDSAEVTSDRLTRSACEQTEFSERKSHRLSSLMHSFWRWISEKIVQDVPEDSAVCEFDCRKGQCDMSEWAHCDRRLRSAAGELWPASGVDTSKLAPSDEESKPDRPASEVETR